MNQTVPTPTLDALRPIFAACYPGNLPSALSPSRVRHAFRFILRYVHYYELFEIIGR